MATQTKKKVSLVEAAQNILQEAAIDTLQHDALTGQEPMHRLAGTKGDDHDPSANMVDVGGSTNIDPSGGPVGRITAAHRSQMMAPKGPSVGAEPMHSGPFNGTQGTGEGGEEDVKPTMATPSGNASTPPGTEEAHADEDEAKKQGVTKEELEFARQARLDSVRSTMSKISVEEDVNAMFSGTELTEEFRSKVKTIFEAAVVARAVAVVEQLETEIIEASEQAVEEIKEELETKVDVYLDHMVEQWMTKNAVAINSGLRTEIAEEFMEGLRNLFVEHYIEIPDEKVDVVESLTSKVEELSSKLNEVINTNVELTTKINESRKLALISKVCEGLTATQADKLKTLAEGVGFTTEGDYSGKLDIIKNQYFSQVNKSTIAASQVMIAESADPTPVEVEITDPAMKAVADAISKQVKYK